MGNSLYNNKQITVADADRIIMGPRFLNDTNAHILKGSVWVQAPFAGFRLICGEILGISEELFKNYSYTYTAEDEVTINPFVLESPSYNELFKNEPQFINVFVSSYISQTKKYLKLYDAYHEAAFSLYTCLNNGILRFNDIFSTDSPIKSLKPHLSEFQSRISNLCFSDFEISYIKEITDISLPEFCELFADSSSVVSSFIINSKKITDTIPERLTGMKECIDRMATLYCADSDNSLFANYIKLFNTSNNSHIHFDSIINELDSIIDEMSNLNNLYTEEFNIHAFTDINNLKSLRNSLYIPLNSREDKSALTGYSKEQIDNCMGAITNLTEFLLVFAEYDDRKKTEFYNSLNAYRLHQKSRFKQDISRGFIKKFEDEYVNLYESVYLQTKIKEETPMPVILFLDYGLISENYIDNSELLKLFHFAKNNSFESKYPVYSFRTWLDTIYSGKNEPSKSELDEDYSEYVRNIKKSRGLTEDEEKVMLEDIDAKIHYETVNFFKSNLRFLFSSNATFCPFINEFDYSKNITDMLNTVNEIEKSMDKWLAFDYMLFYRDEILSINYKGINEKTLVRKEILPNIIIMPIFGQKGCMWQELANRSHKEPARFTLPLYKSKSDDDLILPVLGKYKWEYARTDMGIRWNDISVKSLTSEYYDYLMFFKKNRDLSDIAKNKIKDRMVAFRNNISEVFVFDYVQYIHYETGGSPRLNKPSREILSKYCPLKKELRQRLSSNPLFENEMHYLTVQINNKINELNVKIKKYEKEGIPVPDIMKEYARDLNL